MVNNVIQESINALSHKTSSRFGSSFFLLNRRSIYCLNLLNCTTIFRISLACAYTHAEFAMLAVCISYLEFLRYHGEATRDDNFANVTKKRSENKKEKMTK